MKISNRQITMIRGAANPVEFNGIRARVRIANQVFEKGDSSRVRRGRSHASRTRRVKADTFINNFMPDEGIGRMGTGIHDDRPITEIVEELNEIELAARETDEALRTILKQLGYSA